MNKSKVAIVKNDGHPSQERCDEMILEVFNLLGGVESVVKPGEIVLVKTNYFAPAPPPVTVDRKTIKGLIRVLKTANPSKIIIAEAISIGSKMGRNVTTDEIADEIGIREAVESEGAELMFLEDVERVVKKVPNARNIEYIDYPKPLLDCDVLINLPCMKTHTQTYVTLGVKNFQGILTDKQRYHSHRDDLNSKLVDIHKVRLSDFTLIDALTAMEGNGSGEAGLAKCMNMYLGSKDMIAADSVSTSCMGFDPLDITTTRLGEFEGLGNANPNHIEVVGKQIEDVKEIFLPPITFTKPYDRLLIGTLSNVDVYIGGACKECWLQASIIGMMLEKLNLDFTLIAGTDPKIPGDIKGSLENVVFLGDCACSATGAVKELRNDMLLQNKGIFANGCPPFRPAMRMIEDNLIERGLMTREMQVERNRKNRIKTYKVYKEIDPTWVPQSKDLYFE